jgi:hypothetical protein
MYCSPDKFRLSHLKLDGYRPTDTVWFCSNCDFQGAMPAVECPACGRESIQAIRVPDVIEARAA